MTFGGTKNKTKSLFHGFAFLALSGCSIYHPQPFTTAEVESNLKVPSESALSDRSIPTEAFFPASSRDQPAKWDQS
jgi:hypothetical protein